MTCHKDSHPVGSAGVPAVNEVRLYTPDLGSWDTAAQGQREL